MSAEPPTQYELDTAFTWVILNTVRLFFRVPDGEIEPYEEKFLKAWRAIPAERRQSALDFDILGESRLEKMREVAKW